MSDDARSCVVIVTVVSAAVIRRSVVWQTDANNRIGRSDFFFWGGGTESNIIDSNRESECSSKETEGWTITRGPNACHYQ